MKKLLLSSMLLISGMLFAGDPVKPRGEAAVETDPWLLALIAITACYIAYRLVRLICNASRRTWLSNLAPGQMVRYNKSHKWILYVDHDAETVELYGGISATFSEIGRA